MSFEIVVTILLTVVPLILTIVWSAGRIKTTVDVHGNAIGEHKERLDAHAKAISEHHGRISRLEGREGR